MSIKADGIRIDALLTGRAAAYTRPGSRSAIAKRPRDGAIRVTALGLDEDEHGDPRVHGGPDKALHHYAFDHYPAWRKEIGEHALLSAPGAFGENISTRGITEADVCIGDRFAFGSAAVEISQGRQPCWKLNDRFAQADMARRVQDSGRSGWYYRVLQPGAASAGDMLRLQARPHPEWSVQRLNRLLFERVMDPTELEPALALPSWRRLIESRLQKQALEDWNSRLQGPAQ